MSKKLATFALSAALAVTATAAYADTLDDVKAKGYVQCGVTAGVPGMSAPDANNNWSGLEVDYCRAMAAAIFNDAEKVRYTPLTSQERFAALSSARPMALPRLSISAAPPSASNPVPRPN
jgi:general L-amino acid transport system substrate-binding protein